MRVALINHTPLAIPVHAMGKCYGVKTTEQSLVRAVSSGHLSLLEHAYASFDIEMSQKCLAQSHVIDSYHSLSNLHVVLILAIVVILNSQLHSWSGIVNATLIAEGMNKNY